METQFEKYLRSFEEKAEAKKVTGGGEAGRRCGSFLLVADKKQHFIEGGQNTHFTGPNRPHFEADTVASESPSNGLSIKIV